MNKMKSLDQLGPIADEMLAGLHADDTLKLRVRQAAAKPARRRAGYRWAPAAVSFAALAVVCALALPRLGGNAVSVGLIKGDDSNPTVSIAAIAAGTQDAHSPKVLADLSAGAMVRSVSREDGSLMESVGGDIAMISWEGSVYRMLKTPQDIRTLPGCAVGECVGEIGLYVQEPSLCPKERLQENVSNVAPEGSQIYTISGQDQSSLLAVLFDDEMRVFQRVSYAEGNGPANWPLEHSFDVRGRVDTLELTGMGMLEGEAADRVAGVLLDNAMLVSPDGFAQGRYLTVTLDSGIRLQLGVSGDTLYGLGGWSCPEFFEAFEAAL